MIWTLAGIGIASYQLVAILTSRPRVSELAHTWPWSVLVWTWTLSLALHFLWEGRSK